MKAGLTTSVVLHAVAIGLGLFSLSSSRSYEAAEVESLPVDIVPVDSVTQIQEGDKKAELSETPSPRPTRNPRKVEGAETAGENDIDLKKVPTPDPSPRQVEKTASTSKPEPTPEPEPKKPERPEPPKEAKEEVPVPATELEPKPQPKQDVEPDPAEKTAAVENPEAESVKLPESAPVPDARPKPPQAQTAKAPERKDAEKPAEEKKAAKRKPEEKKDELLDDVAALLDKQKPSGGGAKRSHQEASLGGDKTTGGEKLSQSELDALRNQVETCWNLPAGAEGVKDLRVSVQFHLTREGTVEGRPEIIDGGGNDGVSRAFTGSVVRAVMSCGPYDLPSEKYETWSKVIMHFDPSEMY